MANRKLRIAINGFGRIGRAFFRAVYENMDGIDIVAINDLGEPDNLAYLLKYDTAYGKAPFAVDIEREGKRAYLIAGDAKIPLYSIQNPGELPWKEYEVDIAVEATGVFAGYEKSRPHLDAGARRVVVTAPVKDTPPEGVRGATVLMGVNDEELETCDISSNASCTTNAGSPLVTILDEAIGIEKAMLNTVHGYTASQNLVDGANDHDWRRGRAAAQNIVPSTTGAAIATTKAVRNLENNFDGIALRVPVVVGSIVDVTFIAKQHTTVEEVNEALRSAAQEDRWKSVFAVTDEPVVSSDIIGSKHASVVDLAFTRVVGGNLVKVLAWYDNEMGYAHALREHVLASGRYLIS